MELNTELERDTGIKSELEGILILMLLVQTPFNQGKQRTPSLRKSPTQGLSPGVALGPQVGILSTDLSTFSSLLPVGQSNLLRLSFKLLWM